MINNKLLQIESIVINVENSRKVNMRNTHSTDTEPEVEINQEQNICQTIKFNNNNQIEEKSSAYNIPTIKKERKNVFEEFIEDLPTYEYDQEQIHRNLLKKKRMERARENKPMNMIDTNNNRFLNYYEAFLYIAEHCIKHGQKFTRENVKQYLKQCYIIDFAHDNFIPITTHLTQKLFNKYFRLIQRELKFI